MAMIRALLVDDEEHALNMLQMLLERSGDIEVIGRANNGFDALGRIGELRPDVAFLDIEMPGMNGIELADRVGNEYPDIQIVFVTAYDRYAITAFEQAAVDYLLKPLEKERLAKTIERVKRESAKRGGLTTLPARAEDKGVESEPPKLKVRLLGDISVIGADRERLKWRTGKEKELFVFLAMQIGERTHRDVLIEALWPGENYQRAKVYLHTCVSLLRKDLRQIGFEDVLKYEGEKYFLRCELLETDYEALLAAIRAIRQTPGAAAVERLEKALALDTGPLLRDEDYVWAYDDVQHLEQNLGELRRELSKLYESSGNYGSMIDSAQRQLAFSPYDEEAYRLLMSGYAASGKHDEVYRVYRQLAERLSELGVEPSEMTKKLIDDIRIAREEA